MARAKREPAAPGLTGQIFSGRYRVLDCLGQGALGSVYLVEHVQVGRRFAMKVLREEHWRSKAIVERFRQEAKLGGRLQDPHTVQVVDYAEWEGAPYLVMEYLEGETLAALLRREGPLPALRAARLVRHACRGTSAAHSLGILHRDLKPSNLFVTKTGSEEICKVLDFGVAKAERDLIATSVAPSTSTGAIVGTLAYMAPEQIRADGDVDVRADVYALGAILYECLAGARPFDAPTPPTLMYKILEEQPRALGELRPDLPVALVRCVHGALERDRDSRLQSARELELMLERFIDGAASGGRSMSAETESGTGSLAGAVLGDRARSHDRPTALPRRRRSVIAPVALALGSAALGLGIGFGMGREAPPPLPSPLSPTDTVTAAALLAEPAAVVAPEPVTVSAPEAETIVAPEPETAAEPENAPPPSRETTARETPVRETPAEPSPALEKSQPSMTRRSSPLEPKPERSEPKAEPKPLSDFERANPYRGGR